MNPLKLQLMQDFMSFIAVIVGMGCVTTIITAWIRRKPQQLSQSAELDGRLSEIADRLERLDNAVDTISLEVERISEGQRFTTKLLTERGTPMSAAAIPEKSRVGSTTPH